MCCLRVLLRVGLVNATETRKHRRLSRVKRDHLADVGGRGVEHLSRKFVLQFTPSTATVDRDQEP